MKVFDYEKIDAVQGNCGDLKESSTEDIGFARAIMKKHLSTTHYHKNMLEFYLVVEGTGALRVKEGNSKPVDIELKPDIVVRIDKGELHQTKNDGGLIIEAITLPVWVEEDELVVNESLF